MMAGLEVVAGKVWVTRVTPRIKIILWARLPFVAIA